ncbi:MAG TPA: hypothetical protein VF704_14055 [Allosphingosinicella sp.]
MAARAADSPSAGGRTRRSRRRRIGLGLGGTLVVILLYVVLAGWVSKALSAEDVQAIAMLRVDAPCGERSGFAGEVRCIRAVQAAVLAIAPDQTCAERGEPIEPMPFIRRGHGCCFDRARFIEKALEHYGYTTRRVALYERGRGYLGLLVAGIDSHAASEVRTARGWLGVDSEQPFILITRAGRPVRYDQYHALPPGALVQRPTQRHSFGFARPFFSIAGLYSRHGKAHGPDLPAPEINYPDFFRYAVLGLD